jgi:hypothetical protein
MPDMPPTRNVQRQRLVFSVLLIRRCGAEKYLAHTIDLTESSARLGGLNVMLTPGEVVEIKRKAQKAKFQVVWMGESGTAMEGQAGFNSLEPDRSIWGVELSSEIHAKPVAGTLNSTVMAQDLKPAAAIPGQPAQDRRRHPRFACEGSATVRSVTGNLVAHGPVKDISAGGIYVETLVPLPVNTVVRIKLGIGDVSVDAEGEVRASHASIGMGIAFQNLTPEAAGNIAQIVEIISEHKAPSSPATAVPPDVQTVSAVEIARACRRLAEQFDAWKRNCPEDEFRDLRGAMEQLHEKFVPLA